MKHFSIFFHLSLNPHILESFKPTPTYLSIRAAKFKADMVSIKSDCSSSSHQKSLAPQCEVGEGAHLSIDLSHLPTLATLDLCANLADKIVGCHVDLFPQPPSQRFVDPPDCTSENS